MIKGIIYDFMRTLYEPETGGLYDGVLPMLLSYKEKGLKQGLVSFGGEEKKQLIERLGLNKILDWYRVIGEKTPAVFRAFLKEFNLRAEEVLVVGDLLNEEIKVGKSIGALTVWVNHNKTPSEPLPINPDYIIDEVTMLSKIVRRLGAAEDSEKV